MSYIFIAHVEEDAEVALKIALALEEAGYATWCYEVDSVPGPSYIVRTGESVAQSQAVVVIISPHSLGSSQVTKEVVRAHESAKYFIPILRDITHTEFQQRQPEWREAIGSATSIRISQDGVEAAIPLIIEGVRLLGIMPSASVDAKRISRIRRALDETLDRPTTPESKIAVTGKPIKEIKKPKSRKRLLITLASLACVAVIAIILAVNSLPKEGNGNGQEQGLFPSATPTSPTATDTSIPSVTSTVTSEPTSPSTPSLTPSSTPTPTPSSTLAGDPVLSLSTTFLDFGTQGTDYSGRMSFEIWNGGGGSLSYTIDYEANGYASWQIGSSWLDVSPLKGESNGEHDTINVFINGLGEGFSSGTIYITSDGGD
jgi:hypothetical protein